MRRYLLSILLLTAVQVIAGPNQAAKLYVDVIPSTTAPDSVSTAVPTTSFWVGVRVADARYLDTYGFLLSYDTARLAFVRALPGDAGEANFLETRGGTPIGFIGERSRRDSTRVSVAYGLPRQDSTKSPNGAGLLALINFRSKGPTGNARYSLREVKLLDWQQTLDTAMTLYGGRTAIQNPVTVLVINRQGQSKSYLREVAWALGHEPEKAGRFLLGRRR